MEDPLIVPLASVQEDTIYATYGHMHIETCHTTCW
jgi:hypothetical protein